MAEEVYDGAVGIDLGMFAVLFALVVAVVMANLIHPSLSYPALVPPSSCVLSLICCLLSSDCCLLCPAIRSIHGTRVFAGNTS